MIMKETELFSPVKLWLEHGGYRVYSEVMPAKGTMRRADVLGLHGGVTTVVELKRTLSLDLMAQAIEWKRYAHLIYAAVPATSRHKKTPGAHDCIHPLAKKILVEHGIGLLYVNGDKVDQVVRPRLNRKIFPILRESLNEYHETHSPDGGSSKGGHITPYRTTMLRVREFLERMHNHYDHDRIRLQCKDGWVSMSDLLDKCSTHYASPKSSLAAALQTFESDWCECKLIGRKRHFRLRPELITKSPYMSGL